MRIAKILATTGITRRTKMAGLLSMLGKTAGRAFKKHPIGAPVAAGAGLAALTGTLGNEESGLVGRNQGKVQDAFGFGTERPTDLSDAEEPFRMQKLSVIEALKNTNDELDKMYADGEINQDEYKYLYDSIQSALSDADFYENRDTTFGILKTKEEAVEAGDPRYKLMTMYDKQER